ncbi:MAG: 2-succinyl-5-enolpyruvyl-6-hydroxy-3-cyclohexene-1-carboxylic-acid synthase [Opitutaceae bacterium]
MIRLLDASFRLIAVTSFPNPNAAASWVLAETLHRRGLEFAVISPGSRSTPLTVALAGHHGIEAIPVLDERSAGFFALGLARRTGRPVVLVCTSGTAAANYFPAVIEARESGVPLIVLTADRPPEMRECSSGQTIDQVKLYGDYPRWQVEMGVPDASEKGLRYVRQTVAQAWRRALDPVAGPVHLNLPFRDPLEPTPEANGVTCDFLGPSRGFFTHLSEVPPAAAGTVRLPAGFLRTRGVLIDGPGVVENPETHALAILKLARRLRWPVLADGVSPVRQYRKNGDPVVISHDRIFRDAGSRDFLKPDCVISFGPLPTSKALRGWLAASNAGIVFVDPGDRNLDPGHGRSIHLRGRAGDLRVPGSGRAGEGAWCASWLKAERTAARHLSRGLAAPAFPFESSVIRTVGRCLRRGTVVFAASSMTIRNVEYFWPAGRGHRFFCNRGANGIDGTLSTALGLAHGGRPTWLLTGDLALLHDANGFLCRPQFRGSLTILLINNDGGGIFEHLPIAAFEPPFETFFATPQTVDFERLSAAHGIGYRRIRSQSELEQAVRARPEPGIRLLEVRTDRKADARNLRNLFRGTGRGS